MLKQCDRESLKSAARYWKRCGFLPSAVYARYMGFNRWAAFLRFPASPNQSDEYMGEFDTFQDTDRFATTANLYLHRCYDRAPVPAIA